MPLRLKERLLPSQTATPGASPIFLPQSAALVDQRGFVTRAWWPWFQQIVDAIVDLMQNGAGGAHHETHEPGGADVLQLTGASRLFGRGSTGAGPLEEIALGTNLSMSGTTLNAAGGGGGGDVVGPSTAVANNVTTFDGTTGKVIKDSGIGISKVVTNNEALTYGGHLTVTVGGGISIQSSALRVGAEGSLIYPDNIRQYFNPGGTTPGLNVGSQNPDPTIAVNGDIWYNDSTQKFRARQNGVTVDLISAAGGGGDVTGPAAATDNNVALFNGATGKIIKDSGVLVTNIAIRNQSNTFTTVTATSNVDAALWMQTPQVVMIDNSQPANARRFDLRNTSQFFVVQVSADGGGALFNALGADRNGDCYVYRNLYEKSRSAPMGHWIDEPFNAANFSVDAGTISGVSVTRNKYFRVGNTLTWQMYGSATLSGGNLLCRVPTVLSNYTMSMQPAYVNSSGQLWSGRVGIWDNTWVVVAITGATAWSGASNWSFSIVLETF